MVWGEARFHVGTSTKLAKRSLPWRSNISGWAGTWRTTPYRYLAPGAPAPESRPILKVSTSLRFWK
jgi:hypothetical protein